MSQSAPPHPFDSDFRVTPELKERFARDGFVKLEGFLNQSAVAMLQDRSDVELNRTSAVNLRAVNFSKVQYDFDSPKAHIFELMERPYFRETLTALTGRDLFLTFEMSFEIEKNVNKGVPWHVGVQSFGFQFAEDFACTLWAPMDPIDANGQRGGMAYVPQHVVSGEYVYSADMVVGDVLKAREEQSGKRTGVQDYFSLRMAFLNNPVMEELLDVHRIEDDFSPGDVLLFNKNVVHRSVMLGDGDLAHRTAYVLRLVDATSRYDLHRARALEFPVEHYSRGLIPYKPATRQHIEIAEAGASHGDLIAECDFFSDRDRRMIRAQAPAGSTSAVQPAPWA
ncbi:MAG: hypothetical protein OXG57_07375 [Acidimicrobiaceae bacterium]|nr:hypothetical protein [Acidimicrobiaceae bacterium]